MTYFQQVEKELIASPRTWLVSGAAGFIGSHLVERLLKIKQHVIGIDNFATGHQHNLDEVARIVGPEAWDRFRFEDLDVADFSGCQKIVKNVDYVLHQAALGSVPRSVENPIASNSANVDGFLALLFAAKEAGINRFVYASSSSVYGDEPQLPKVESQIGNPLSPYAVTKRVNELYSSVFESAYGSEIVGLRYFNVFGPRQDPDGAYAAVIPRWVDTLKKGEQCLIFGDGETSRDFCFIENVVEANILAACSDRDGAFGKNYNIAVGDRTTLNELYYYLRDEVSKKNPSIAALEPEYRDFRVGDVRHSLADISLAREFLGYEPQIAVREGIKNTVNWFLEKN